MAAEAVLRSEARSTILSILPGSNDLFVSFRSTLHKRQKLNQEREAEQDAQLAAALEFTSPEGEL